MGRCLAALRAGNNKSWAEANIYTWGKICGDVKCPIWSLFHPLMITIIIYR